MNGEGHLHHLSRNHGLGVGLFVEMVRPGRDKGRHFLRDSPVKEPQLALAKVENLPLRGHVLQIHEDGAVVVA